MAKAISAHVPKTSGQGVSRLSYQQGYDLGMKGGGAFRSPDLKQPKIKTRGDGTKGGRSYDKLSVPGIDTDPPKADISLRAAKAREYGKGPSEEAWQFPKQKGELKFGS